MAYYDLPTACLDCEHPACLDTRRIAAAVCPYCRTSIGYGARVVFFADESIAHWSCDYANRGV